MFMVTTPRKTILIYDNVSVYVAVRKWDLE